MLVYVLPILVVILTTYIAWAIYTVTSHTKSLEISTSAHGRAGKAMRQGLLLAVMLVSVSCSQGVKRNSGCTDPELRVRESAATMTRKTFANHDYLAYEGDFHEEVIKPQAEAWKKVAKVIYPQVCDDTETRWAGNMADSLANELIMHLEWSHPEQVAQLSLIQYYLGYGMSYFSALTGLYKSDSKAADFAFHSVSYALEELGNLRSEKFSKPLELLSFEQGAYALVGMFMEIGGDYPDSKPAFLYENKMMNYANGKKVAMIFEEIPNEIQAFRYGTLIDNTTFYMSYCPLTFWLAGPEFQAAHQEEYMKMAAWFDEKVSNVNKKIDDDDLIHLPPLNFEDYTRDTRQAALFKARIITFLAEAIQTLHEPKI